MTNLVDRPTAAGQIPVHVLIIIVGKYFEKSLNLGGASEFTQELVDFWKSKRRHYPANQSLATIDVLASDPDGSTYITGDGTVKAVDSPNFANVRRVMRKWVKTIEQTEGAVGFLHWIGHGNERSRGGAMTTLCCEADNSEDRQPALNWTRTLGYINDRLRDRSVYCFLDACRTQGEEREYSGIEDGDSYDLWAPERAYVFTSTEMNS
ncbi:hypothetical protein FJ987_16440, partial [Mesorhizobium sp. CU2]|uniref:caspase family protein n=3 Tax=unclassified Mesorhizobium TaxID=325217 RepID=UPI00112851A0